MRNGISAPRVVSTLSFRSIDGVVHENVTTSMNLTGQDVYSGIENLNWRTQVRHHLDATTPANATRYTSKLTQGSISAYIYIQGDPVFPPYNYQLFRGISNSGVVPAALSSPAVESARNQAISRLYAQIRANTPIGEDLAQWRQTCRTLDLSRNSLAKLIDSLSGQQLNLLRGSAAQNWNSTKRLARSLADLSLEYQFGVKPLIRDFEDVKKRLADGPSYGYAPLFASAKVQDSGVINVADYSLTSFLLCTRTSVSSKEAKHRFIGERRFEFQPSHYSLMNSLGLTWREMVPTLYNLIPYSFLVDYVTNLGDIVDSIAVPWSDVVWCCSTSRLVTRSQISYQGLKGPVPIVKVSPLSVVFPRADVYGTVFSRTRQDGLPVPGFQFLVPRPGQLTNVLALVTSRLPVIRGLTKQALSSKNGRNLDSDFLRLERDLHLRNPYPFHR